MPLQSPCEYRIKSGASRFMRKMTIRINGGKTPLFIHRATKTLMILFLFFIQNKSNIIYM